MRCYRLAFLGVIANVQADSAEPRIRVRACRPHEAQIILVNAGTQLEPTDATAPQSQKPASKPTLGIVTGPIDVEPKVSLLSVAFNTSNTKESHALGRICQRFSSRRSSL